MRKWTHYREHERRPESFLGILKLDCAISEPNNHITKLTRFDFSVVEKCKFQQAWMIYSKL